MVFTGISRSFSTRNEAQYDTIGAFWDELAAIHGIENLRGLGYGWTEDTICYAIGLKSGSIDGANLTITLPDSGWLCRAGRTDQLGQMYDEIYQDGPLLFEIETFFPDGSCVVQYCR